MKRFLILLLLFAIGFFSLVSAHDVFAADDITFVLSTSTTNQNYTFCDSVSSCSGYRYLSVTPNFTVNASDSNVPLRFRFNGSSSNGSVTIPYSTNQTIIKLDEGISSITYFMQTSTNAFITGDRTITMVLSESLPDVPPCPDCPTCPPETDPNRSSIMQDFHDVFMNTFVSIIYVCPIIFIVWFFIDIITSLVFGRGR